MNNPSLGGFNLIVLYPLIAIYKVLSLINFPHPLGVSIVVLTVLLRFALYPFVSAQIKASKKMQEINPKLSEVREKHKGNNALISQETMRIYKEHGINPAAGCLPVLIQLPVIWILYSVLQNIIKDPSLVTEEINKVIALSFLKLTSPLDQSFFFFPLGKTPVQVFPPSHFLNPISPDALILIVPIVTAILQFIQSKMMFNPLPTSSAKKDDFSSAFASQSTYIFPLMIGFFSYSFPFGLSLYWNTFTLFGIIQQYKVAGLGGLSLWKK